MKFGILGCGNMGEAFLKSVLETRVFSPQDILVCEHNAERKDDLVSRYKIIGTTMMKELENCDILLLAIKPQNLSEVTLSLRSDVLVISMLVGTSLKSLYSYFVNTKIVRIMPNLGQFVGKGMTGILFDPEKDFSPNERKLVEKILSSGGRFLEVESEDALDQLSTISGSGPAYFFAFAEKLVLSAQSMVFSKESAELLVRQTLLGSAKILEENTEDSFETWRKRVTSKGGTTEQALKIFEDRDLGDIVKKATESAYKRAKELS